MHATKLKCTQLLDAVKAHLTSNFFSNTQTHAHTHTHIQMHSKWLLTRAAKLTYAKQLMLIIKVLY